MSLLSYLIYLNCNQRIMLASLKVNPEHFWMLCISIENVFFVFQNFLINVKEMFHNRILTSLILNIMKKVSIIILTRKLRHKW